jgi:uncharacterized membrane protein
VAPCSFDFGQLWHLNNPENRLGNRYRTETVEIQPRTFGDSLSDLIKMLGKVWRPLLMPALATSVVVAVFSYFVLTSTDAIEFFDLTLNNPEAINSIPADELGSLIVNFFYAISLVGIVSSLAYGFLYLAAARAVGEVMSVQPSGRSVVGAAVASMLFWLLAFVPIFVGSIVGFVLFVIPGVWFLISASMTAQVIAIEGLGPIAAIKRSFSLIKGNWWETFGFTLLIGLIGGTASQLIQLVALPVFLVGSPSFAFGITIAAGVAFQGLIVAAISVGLAIWYFNLRARTDGPYLLQLV